MHWIRCFSCTEPELVRMLLDAGANPNQGIGDLNPMQSLICNFESSLERCSSCHDPEVAVRCLEIAAAFGGRWRPDSHAFRYFRQSVGQASPNSVVSRISRIVKAGAIEQDVFRELMNTKKMTEVLNSGGPGSVFLREFAGQAPKPQSRRRNRRSASANQA